MVGRERGHRFGTAAEAAASAFEGAAIDSALTATKS